MHSLLPYSQNQTCQHSHSLPLPTRPLQITSATVSFTDNENSLRPRRAAASMQPRSQTPFHHPQVGSWGVGLGWAHEGGRAGSMCTCWWGLHGVWCISPITYYIAGCRYYKMVPIMGFVLLEFVNFPDIVNLI